LTAVIRGGSDQGMIVGVAGRNGAGKGEVIKLLEAKGYVAHSLSDAIRDVLRERGLEESRERMIETGRALRAEGGPGVLGERLAAKMDPAQDYAIDSVRHPAEVAALRASGQPFVLLWVDADLGVRFEGNWEATIPRPSNSTQCARSKTACCSTIRDSMPCRRPSTTRSPQPRVEWIRPLLLDAHRPMADTLGALRPPRGSKIGDPATDGEAGDETISLESVNPGRTRPRCLVSVFR